MRQLKVPALFGFAFLCMFFSPSASGQGTWYQCRSWGKIKGIRDAVYVTPYVRTDAAASTINAAYFSYMHATYPDHYVSTLPSWSDFCQRVSGDPGQQAFTLSTEEKQWAASKWEVIHLNWTYSPVEVATTDRAIASAASAAAAVSTAAANEYYVVCASGRAGPVVYFSEIFAAAPPPGTQPTRLKGTERVMFPRGWFQTPFFVFLQKKYGFKGDSNYPVECGADFAPTTAGLQQAQRYKQGLEDLVKQNNARIVETGWKNQ